MPTATHPLTLDCRGRTLSLGRETAVMGILNVTPDSFSDGGQFIESTKAIAQSRQMAEEGAAVIDIGGQSTRPGYAEISAEEETARVLPVLRASVPHISVPYSIDTYKSVVARAALEAGAHLVNDVHGLQGDAAMAAVVAEYECPVILMHQDPVFRETAGDVIEKLKRYFEKSFAIADRARIAREKLILDPGIGFWKTAAQNLEIMSRLDELRAWGYPVLLGVSRKSTIGQVLDLPAHDRLEGTLATTAVAAWLGVELVRVHDVRANVRVAKMVAAMRAAHPSS